MEFPPVQGQYTGDYIYITEPGRYTLEHPVNHQYPIGIIIAAPSVILDGQGYSIHPAPSGSSPTVGIWVCLTDLSGRPVTGITIRNVSIEGEGYGIYTEGIDSSEFEWSRDRSGDLAASAAVKSPRTLTLSEMVVSGCKEGVSLNNQIGVRMSDMNISGSSGSGVTLHDGQVQIIRCQVTGNTRYGIHIQGSSGTEISSSTIQGNGESGIRLEKVSGVTIYNNILDNRRNLESGAENSEITLATTRRTGDNIVGGRVIGGNYWAGEEGLLPSSAGAADKDSDGIADIPYNPVADVSDPLPLLKPDNAISTGILTLNPDVTPIPLPIASVAPVVTPATFMSGIHAVIISDTIPAEMVRGTSYPVDISLYNDGSNDWIGQHQVGIRALDDTATYGPSWMAVPVPVSGSVGSGQTQVIQFTLRAPTKPGIYTLKYQAAREGSGVEVLFGRAYTKTVTVN